MKYDGTVLIDTSMSADGMEEGFKRIKDEVDSVAIEAQRAGNQIGVAFSKIDVSKPVANAMLKVKMLEQQLAAANSDFKAAVAIKDNKETERNERKRTSLYDRLEVAREKLAIEVAAAAQREAAAEEKAAQRAAAAAQREAAAKEKAAKKQLASATKGMRRFHSRMREIVSGALVFNLISAGLRSVTDYFGSALKSSDAFQKSWAKLKAALLTAFQPIYEVALPLLLKLMDVATRVAYAIGHIFATLAGKSHSQMAKNAKALYDQANATEKLGQSAKKAGKYLASFDEIQKANNTDAAGAAGGGVAAPDFEAMQGEDYQSKLEEIITLTSLALLGLGTILAFSGINIPLGIALMALGAAGLYSEISTNWEGMKEVLQGPIGNVMAIVSGALLVIGAILAFSGANIPLGIGMMLLGAAGLAAKVAAHWDTLKEPVMKALASILAIMSASLMVVGILLCLSGAGIGLGLALIFAGLAGTRAAWSLSDNPITQFVKNMANSIINILNIVIDAVNKLFDLKFDGLFVAGVEVIPAFHKKLFSIPKIPMLAQGAVIPPNAPFAAILGDQRHGTNIEAPLSTIQDAVAVVMEDHFSGMMAGFEEMVAVLREILEAVYGIQVGDDVIAEAVARHNRKMNIARGGA